MDTPNPSLGRYWGRARAGPRPAGRAGPQPMGRASMIFCGPGRVRARAGPGLVNNNFAGCEPGLGLTFPGLGRARAYSESHSCFNIMVKYYRQISIAMSALFSIYTVNVTALCFKTGMPATLLSIQYSTMVPNH